MRQQLFQFKDDGVFPNSNYPVLIYKNCFSERGELGAQWLEKNFSENDWTNSWRNGVYDYHHYHSNTHEVLGVFNGTALLQLGGEKGEKIAVTAGDVLIIPAGVAHKNLKSENFKVVGAYPQGKAPNMNTGKEGERPGADKLIAAVSFPEGDPLQGKDGPLLKIWK